MTAALGGGAAGCGVPGSPWVSQTNHFTLGLPRPIVVQGATQVEDSFRVT